MASNILKITKFQICFDLTIKFFSSKLNFGTKKLSMGIWNTWNEVHCTSYN